MITSKKQLKKKVYHFKYFDINIKPEDQFPMWIERNKTNIWQFREIKLLYRTLGKILEGK